MALNPSFLTSQTIGAPSIIHFEDNSTGSDGAIVGRRIYLQKADGTYLVPDGTTTDYIVWALVDTTIDVNVLPVDMALNVRVDWVATGGSVLYTLTKLQLYQLYSNTFYYNTIQLQASMPNVINDSNYWGNVSELQSYIDNAVQAVALGGDIAAAQNACDKATYLISNQNLNF